MGREVLNHTPFSKYNSNLSAFFYNLSQYHISKLTNGILIVVLINKKRQSLNFHFQDTNTILTHHLFNSCMFFVVRNSDSCNWFPQKFTSKEENQYMLFYKMKAKLQHILNVGLHLKSCTGIQQFMSCPVLNRHICFFLK